MCGTSVVGKWNIGCEIHCSREAVSKPWSLSEEKKTTQNDAFIKHLCSAVASHLKQICQATSSLVFSSKTWNAKFLTKDSRPQLGLRLETQNFWESIIKLWGSRLERLSTYFWAVLYHNSKTSTQPWYIMAKCKQA